MDPISTTCQDTIDLFAAVLNSIADGVIVVDAAGKLLFSNRSAERLLSEKAITGDPIRWSGAYQLCTGDTETEYPNDRVPLHRALNGEAVTAEEVFLRSREDDSTRWLSISSQPIFEPSDSKIIGAVAVFRDITEPRRTEKTLKANERRYKFLSSLSGAIAEAGPHLNRLVSIVVESAAEAIGDACILSLLTEDQTLKITAVAHEQEGPHGLLNATLLSVETGIEEGLTGSVMTSGEPLFFPSISEEHVNALTRHEFEPYISKYGLQGIMIAPMRDQDRILGTLIVMRDRGGKAYTKDEQSLLLDISHITSLGIVNAQMLQTAREEVQHRRSIEQELAENEALFRSIFEASTLGIKLLDTEGRIIRVNPAAQAILGYPKEELEGKRFSEFTHPLDLPRSERCFKDLLSGVTQRYRMEKRYITRSGEVVWADMLFNTVNDADGRPQFVMAVIENITQRKEMEAELAEMRSRMLDSAERERLFLAQELHDGPMQELHGIHFQLKALGLQQDPEMADSLNDISENIQVVLSSLRDTAKTLRPPAIMDFGLANAIRSHVEDLQEQNPDLSIQMALAEDQTRLPQRVRLALFRVFQQAMMNTIRHADANEVNIRFTLDPQEAILEISDDGIGFEVPGSWINLVREGHFGLAGASERIETLGGSFRVLSEPGGGTTLLARIPNHTGEE